MVTALVTKAAIDVSKTATSIATFGLVVSDYVIGADTRR